MDRTTFIELAEKESGERERESKRERERDEGFFPTCLDTRVCGSINEGFRLQKPPTAIFDLFRIFGCFFNSK